MTKYAVISFENSTVSRVMAEFPKNYQPIPMVYADEAGDSFELMSDLIDSTCSAIDGEVVRTSIDAKMYMKRFVITVTMFVMTNLGQKICF